ncbi:MAG TPA: small multi-drug export protein [Candidatus Omnitrophota bacterium]|nr:small multi-drug export protein [Candidatus Omnitrophota bacterium]
MTDQIAPWLSGLPKDYIVLITAALPVSELRGAIPLALSFGMTIQKAFLLSVIGNFIPVIPVLFLLEPVSNWLGRFRFFARFFDWLFTRTRKKADTIQKYEMLGLAIFIAIPLPMTGAWSGAIAASLLKIKFRYAITGIILGILGAGLIVSALCTLGIMGWQAVTD